MALSDEIQDAITRHQIYLLRYSAGREKEAAEYIARIQQMIESEMEVDELSEMDLQQLNRFYNDVTQFSDEVMGELGQKMIDDASSLAELETEWNASMLANMLSEDISLPTNINSQLSVFAGTILAGVLNANISNAINQFRQQKTRQLTQNLRDGVTLRQPNTVIAERVAGVSKLHQKQANTLIRTISNHVSVQTRDLVFRENIGFFDGYEWVSVLDSRTSLICASRDGKVYPFSDDPVKSPKPPAHFSCRSTITPKVKAGYEDRVKKQKPRKAIGAKGETTVRSTTTYESWLKRQPASFQDDVLGVTRGKLFRQGGLPISKFVDQSGKTLTLDELRKIEPEVFNRVKL